MAAPAAMDMTRIKKNGPNWAKNASVTFGAGPCMCMCYCCKPMFNCMNGCLDSCCYTLRCCKDSCHAIVTCNCGKICGLFRTCMADACGKCLPSCCKPKCCCGVPSVEKIVREGAAAACCCSFRCLCTPCCNCIDSICLSLKKCVGACLKRTFCICCPNCIDHGCVCYGPCTACGVGCAIKGCCGCGPCTMDDASNKYVSDVAKAKAAGGAPQVVEFVGAPDVVATIGAPATAEMQR